MKYAPDAALDAGLADLSNVTHVFLCSLPAGTSYAQVLAARLGSKAGTFAAAADGSPDGRARTFAAFVDGTQHAAGTANHWAAVDEAGTTVYRIAPLAADVPFVGTGVFPCSAITITSRDLA